MADRNLRDFYGRVGRIDRAHARGYGFEGPDVLGRSHYRPRRRFRVPLLGPLLVLVLLSVSLKGVIHYRIGADAYAAKIETLAHSDAIDRVSAFVMQPDVATRWVSARLDVWLR